MVGIWLCHIPTLHHYDRFPPGGNVTGGNMLVGRSSSLSSQLSSSQTSTPSSSSKSSCSTSSITRSHISQLEEKVRVIEMEKQQLEYSKRVNLHQIIIIIVHVWFYFLSYNIWWQFISSNSQEREKQLLELQTKMDEVFFKIKSSSVIFSCCRLFFSSNYFIA